MPQYGRYGLLNRVHKMNPKKNDVGVPKDMTRLKSIIISFYPYYQSFNPSVEGGGLNFSFSPEALKSQLRI